MTLAPERQPRGRPLKPGRLVRLAMVARCNGNAGEAARRMGIDPHLLNKWLCKLARTEGSEHLPKWNEKRRGPPSRTAPWPAPIAGRSDGTEALFANSRKR
jgi:hypothetical protein